MKKFFLSPSILSANFSQLGRDVQKVMLAGGDMVHFDVMDNNFVPNLTIGPMVLKSLRDYGIKSLVEVHLMVSKIDNLIPLFANSGADFITFHPECTNHIDKTISMIKQVGCKVGMAFNPSTSLEYLKYTIHRLDLILIMSVNPGFGGQKFISNMLLKIQEVKKIINDNKLDTILEVDGGITESNIFDIAVSGANSFVVGSSIFDSADITRSTKSIKKKLKKIFSSLSCKLVL